MTEAPDPGEAPDWLSPAELGMWQAFRNGSTYDLRTRNPVRDDPFAVRPWGPERSVRARVVALLLLSGPPALPGRVAALKLTGVQITGLLNLSGGTVTPYVELNNCRFENEVLLPEAHFTTVRMVSCAIPRLEAARLTTEGDLHLPRCRVPGGIRLTDAHIGTDLLLSQAVVHGDRNGRSIAADGLLVGQDLQADLIESYGELSLRAAKVGVTLSLRGSRLINPDGGRALNAPQLIVERTLYLTSAAVYPGGNQAGTTPPYGTQYGTQYGTPYGANYTNTPVRGTLIQPFECRGGLRLDDGRFGDAVDLAQSRVVMSDVQELSLRRIQTPELRFTGQRAERGKVVLSGARVVNLVDMADSWPRPGHLTMNGFAYENLIPIGTFTLAQRLDWVTAATPEYGPEPYERLAGVLRGSGEDADAREVLLAKQRRRRETLPLAAKAWGVLQDLTVAYGYRPGRAALWMAVLWAAGTLAFSHYDPRPIKPDEHPDWNAALYALDLLIPVVNLGQDGYWRLSGVWQWAAALLILLGWILATTVAAGASRLLRRG
ncbi:oxidoreductase [Streptomyces sp. NPDC006632]|uniref:oxidoreductase n=1 Tax=unclassified Streptomyces TaxID=2593676 RepID=UPI002E212FA5